MKLWPSNNYLLVDNYYSTTPKKTLVNLEAITSIEIEPNREACMNIVLAYDTIKVKEDDLKRILQALGIEG